MDTSLINTLLWTHASHLRSDFASNILENWTKMGNDQIEHELGQVNKKCYSMYGEPKIIDPDSTSMVPKTRILTVEERNRVVLREKLIYIRPWMGIKAGYSVPKRFSPTDSDLGFTVEDVIKSIQKVIAISKKPPKPYFDGLHLDGRYLGKPVYVIDWSGGILD